MLGNLKIDKFVLVANVFILLVMMRNILFSICVFISITSYCQEGLTKEEVKKYTEMTSVAEGTYQIQMVDTRSLPSIPLELIKTIEEKRHDTKTIYFYYKPDIRIKILSRKEIENKKLEKDEKIIYITSNDL